MDGVWDYIGDGVYAKCDGNGILIHVGSHNHPTDRVYLEPEVIAAIVRLSDQMKGR
jgi:hypothetical protein